MDALDTHVVPSNRILFFGPGYGALLFAAGALITFALGPIVGLLATSSPIPIPRSGTYFVVTHYHYTILGGSMLLVFAGLYLLYPRVTGRVDRIQRFVLGAA
ncbi:MAG TPA: cbb3-type cytochrome c oxidase subunit I [Candidatus Baltobacteraceae bacterium]